MSWVRSLVAGFQVTISGRFWVITEGRASKLHIELSPLIPNHPGDRSGFPFNFALCEKRKRTQPR